jgi:hypothetical protein
VFTSFNSARRRLNIYLNPKVDENFKASPLFIETAPSLQESELQAF